MEALENFIESLVQEAVGIQTQGRALRPDEIARVRSIYEALPLLKQAFNILNKETISALITYKIVSDSDGKIKRVARVACNFWNRFVIPDANVVIRLGIFTSNGSTIARAYKPYTQRGVVYGNVEFNTKYLSTFSENGTAATVIHEIGHTLGFGWGKWMNLFDNEGKFTVTAIQAIPDLAEMRVETDYGPGTKYSHWDEQKHDKELMTGFKDSGEIVLPVTIKIMSLLGHSVIEELSEKACLNTLLETLAGVMFSRKAEAKAIDLDHFERTNLWENIPHNQ